MTTKFSDIVAAGAISGTDKILGVQSGPTDVVYTVTNMATAIISAGNIVTSAAVLTSGRIPMGDGARGLADTGAGTIGTSLAIGGATIGSNALAVTGTALFGGTLTGVQIIYKNATTTGQYIDFNDVPGITLSNGVNRAFSASTTFVSINSNLPFGFSPSIDTRTPPDTIWSRSAAATWQSGAADAAVAVAQTTRVQSVVAGTAAASGANWTLIGSLPTGTGTSGDIIFQTGVKTGSGTTQGTATTALTIKGETQQVNFAGSILIGAGKITDYGSGQLGFGGGGASTAYLNSAGWNLGTIGVKFQSTNDPINGTTDTVISRVSAGVVGIGLTANGQATGSLNLTNLTGTGTMIIGTGDAASSTGGALQVTGGASVAKRFWIPAITASAGLQTAVLCQSSGGEMIADSVACLASSARFKTLLGNAEGGALDKIIRVPIQRWQYNRDPGSVFPDNYYSEHIGPTAEDIEAIDSRLVGRDQDGKARSISTDQLLALAIQAIQEQQGQIEELRAR